MTVHRFGRQVCGDIDAAASREWLVPDGLGGYAMGTIGGLRTRRYHGLLIVADDPPGRRRLGLAALEPVLVLGDRRIELATHEWVDGTIAPRGHLHLASFELIDGVPRWRWSVDDVVLEMEVAADRGRAAVGVVFNLVRAPGPVNLEVGALCTWRDVHGERWAGPDPTVTATTDGFVFEGAYRVAGPDHRPGGAWYRGFRYREEAARGLTDREDLWHAGRFVAELAPGGRTGITAWADQLDRPPPPAATLVASARARARRVVRRSRSLTPGGDRFSDALALAADQFVVTPPGRGSAGVIAGYPWFGEWSRDTMTSYEGLFLDTNRAAEGRGLLLQAAASLSGGMLPNTADTGTLEYNTADATLWFIHAVGRHVSVTGDLDLAAKLSGSLHEVVEQHLAGTRHGIGVDRSDGLLSQGDPGVALTWMDARIGRTAVTPRMGKAVEVNALWVNALGTIAEMDLLLGWEDHRLDTLIARSRSSFRKRFVRDATRGATLWDVIDGPDGNDRALRPNQLLAVSLPHGPMTDPDIVRACRPLATSMGMRSLSPTDPAYRPHHRGGPTERDLAYHQGTVWPWLLGPYVSGSLRCGLDPTGVLDGLEAHLGENGLGSIAETAEGVEPHMVTGCPFQAWSVAEVLRGWRQSRADGSPGTSPTQAGSRSEVQP